jgi:hypothetical protein
MPQTKLQLLQYEYRLSEDENEEIFHARIVPENNAATESTLKPIAIIVAGQTASGKSTLIGSSKDELEFEGSAVEICSDNMRPYHPQYEYLVEKFPDNSTYIVNDDAVKWVDKLIRLCIDTKRNIILESTIKEADKIIDTVNYLKDEGYNVHLKIMAVNPIMSKLGMYQRYEGEMMDNGHGRWIGTEIHDDRVKHLPVSFKKILDKAILDDVEVYGRRFSGNNAERFKVTLLTNDKEKAFGIFNKEVHRPFDSQEQEFYEHKIRQVYEQIKNRGGDYENFVRDMNAEYLFNRRKLKR